MDFDATGQLLILHSALVKYLRKNRNKRRVYQLLIDFKKGYDTVRREVLYNILIALGVPMILVRLIRMCLKRTSIAEYG